MSVFADVYEAEKIVDMRRVHGRYLQVRIRWMDFGEEYDTWEWAAENPSLEFAPGIPLAYFWTVDDELLSDHIRSLTVCEVGDEVRIHISKCMDEDCYMPDCPLKQ